MTVGTDAPTGGKTWFGHPRGLSTLFFTEMWERFSYYGMRAILTLFMITPIAAGGLGFTPAKAGPIYAMYTSLVYLVTVPGGWLADNFLGQRKSVLYGGFVIMIGHILLAMQGLTMFYAGLTCVIIGTGLLKPNISVIVGQLYSQKDVRRDAGFSIFYMGINVGAFTSPLVCGWLAQSEKFSSMLEGWGMDPKHSWHWGFGAAAVGMFLGLVQYLLSGHHLGDAGLKPVAQDGEQLARHKRTLWIGVLAVVAMLVGLGAYEQTAIHYDSARWQSVEGGVQVTGFSSAGEAAGEAVIGEAPIAVDDLESMFGEEQGAVIAASLEGGQASGTVRDVDLKVGGLNSDNIHTGFTFMLLAVVIGFFLRLFLSGNWTQHERARLITIFVLFWGAAIFWGIFEQAGSTLTIFAEQSTRGSLFGMEFPSSWFQSVNPLLIVALSPFFAWLWVRLASRNPSYPAKFGIGLLLVGLGFILLVGGASAAKDGALVSPFWLLGVYFLHTVGELCLSPVGLSSMTKLAPTRVVSLMMGVWFLAASVGNFIGGSVAGFYEDFALTTLLGVVGASGILMALLMFALVGPMKRMMERAEASEAKPSPAVAEEG